MTKRGRASDDKLPFMPTYVSDILGSTKVREMVGFEPHVYLFLLAIQWSFKGEGLPTDDRRLAKLAGLSAEEWESVRGIIDTCFEERDGRLFNARCHELWEEKKAKVAQASEAGKKSGEARRKAGEGGEQVVNGRSNGCPNERTNGRSNEPPNVRTNHPEPSSQDGTRKHHLPPSGSLPRSTRAGDEDGSDGVFARENGKNGNGKTANGRDYHLAPRNCQDLPDVVQAFFDDEVRRGMIEDTDRNRLWAQATACELVRKRSARVPLKCLRTRIEWRKEGRKERGEGPSDEDDRRATGLVKKWRPDRCQA